MTTNLFETIMQTAPTTPAWHSLFKAACDGLLPAPGKIDDDAEIAHLKTLMDVACEARTDWLMDLLMESDARESGDISMISAGPVADDTNTRERLTRAPGTYLTLPDDICSEALAGGEDPLALDMDTASYAAPGSVPAESVLAIAQIASAAGNQAGIDAILRSGRATLVLCERAQDVTPVREALGRFRATPPRNDFADAAPALPARIVTLDGRSDLPTDISLSRFQQALSDQAALIVVTAVPGHVTGALAHLPILSVRAPDRDVIMAVLRETCSATGRMSEAAVRAALPTDARLRRLGPDDLLLALRADGPIRAARRISEMVTDPRAAPPATGPDKDTHARILTAAATAVVAHLTSASRPVSVLLTATAFAVPLRVSGQGVDSVNAQLFRLMAGRAMARLTGDPDIGGDDGSAASPRAQATRLALREALSGDGRGALVWQFGDIDPTAAFARHRDLQARVSRRLQRAEDRAVALLRRNARAVDIIAGHLTVDRYVDAATLPDLLAFCVDRDHRTAA